MLHDPAAGRAAASAGPAAPETAPSRADYFLACFRICRQLRSEYPAYRITVDTGPQPPHLFTAIARSLGTHPYAVATSDAASLRAALDAGTPGR
jgi:hypothetical protein